MATPGKSSAGSKAKAEGRLVSKNRKAYFDYEVLEEIEVGVALLGTEVKSLREGLVNLGDGHARIRNGEVFLLNVHISPYRLGTHENHEPMRARKLLLRRREILRVERRVAEKGLALIPLAIYFNARGLCKVKLGVCRGKKLHDKRRAIADRDVKRQIAHAVRRGPE